MFVHQFDEELFKLALALRRDDSALQQNCAQLVDQGRTFADQSVSRSMERLQIELLLALQLDKPHRRARHRFGDPFGVAIVVLLRLDVGQNIFGGHQPHLVPGRITRRRAKRGTRPPAPERSAHRLDLHLFGAICPKEGKAVGLILPRCNIEAMQLHLDEIAKDIEPGRHAVLMVDKAGWHTSPKLDVPENLTLVPLPAKCPELNPVENVWEFMRDNWLSNRIFLNYDDIVDHCCDAWNKLRNQPWRVMSIGLRDWAHKC